MKITLNLSPPSSARERFALAWAIPATLIGLAALILLGRASLFEYHDYLGMQHQLAEVQWRAEELGQQEAAIRRKLEDPAYRELLIRARFVNQLIDQRKLALTEVSARLAGLLPEDAHLTGLALTAPKKSGEDYALRMGITAKGEDAVETFINDLVDAPDFKDVSIINQGFQEEASQGSQVNLVCTASYLPGVEDEIEAKSQEPEAPRQKPEAGSKAPGAASPKPEAGSKASGLARQKPEAGSKAPGPASQKPEVGSKAPGPASQKPAGKTPEPQVRSQKVEKTSAEKSTSDRKSSH